MLRAVDTVLFQWRIYLGIHDVRYVRRAVLSERMIHHTWYVYTY